MNFIFFGKEADLNIGNGKTISAVRQLTRDYLRGNIIYSNIILKDVDYIPLNPRNLYDCLDTKNASVLFDEIHAIVHKNHRIGEYCKKHKTVGLCYHLSEFFRQVRKRSISTYSTAQVFSDSHFQFRTLMQEQILCEKFYPKNNALIKCESDNCEHELHFIRNYNIRNQYEEYFNSKPYHNLYVSSEIVKGWI